jgi:hypothetical protein
MKAENTRDLPPLGTGLVFQFGASSLQSALFGALVGVWMALILATLYFETASPNTLSGAASLLLPSSWAQITTEPREKGFLALAAIMGVLGALSATWQRPLVQRPVTLGSAFFLIVTVLVTNLASWTALSKTDAFPLVVAYGALLVACGFFTFRYSPKWGIELFEIKVPILSGRNYDVQLTLITALVLALALLPRSIDLVAAQIGYEMHIVSFIVGPALYSLHPGLVPGIDYLTQYSVGLPYLFHFLLVPSADAVVIRYAWLILICMHLYYLSATLFLRWLFSSWPWALGIAACTLVLQFHTERPFFDPSSFILRHPLQIINLALFAWWVGYRQSLFRGTVLASSLAASLFLNTETGIYQLLCFTLLTPFFNRSWGKGFLCSALLVSASILFFSSYCLLAFGPRVLSAEFFIQLTEPFFIYGGGFGAWPIDWRWGWHLLYNVIAPGLALATIGWGCSSSRVVNDEIRSRVAAITAVAFLAIAISAKYWNMSIIGLWYVNAFGFLVIIAWWTKITNQGLYLLPAIYRLHRPQLQKLAGVVLFGASILLLATANDPRNPSLYGAKAYAQFPSVLLAPFAKEPSGCAQLSCAAPRISAIDVQLIQELVPNRSQAPILDLYDWAYLIEAQRMPQFAFLPSTVLFTKRQLANALKNDELLFLPRGLDGKPTISQPELNAILGPQLATKYETVGVGERLIALRRIGQSNDK